MARLVLVLLLVWGLVGPAWANAPADPRVTVGFRVHDAHLVDSDYYTLLIETLLIETGGLSKKDLASSFYNRGNMSYRLERYERAIRDYSRALILDPTNADAYYNRANTFADLDRHDRAVEDYSQAIRLAPGHDFAYYNRANSYVVKGDRQRAIDDYRKAYALNPDDPVYRDKMRELGLLK